ncbi:unnamed protein product [Pieris brassicae]|uniref:DDE-1 domain-containing protein n=1 Tax=Pieris brassicae TaxID=7116 RepID=A0A9P0XFT0_PIEBR|nr:unnamed protein product [Pieris brassicae]
MISTYNRVQRSVAKTLVDLSLSSKSDYFFTDEEHAVLIELENKFQPVKLAVETGGTGKTDSGWMTCEAFFEFFANLIYTWLIKNDELHVLKNKIFCLFITRDVGYQGRLQKNGKTTHRSGLSNRLRSAKQPYSETERQRERDTNIKPARASGDKIIVCKCETSSGGDTSRNSHSGWFDMNLFEVWFFKLLLPTIQEERIENETSVVIVDNLGSYFSPEFVQAAVQNNIYFTTLTPNSTHIMQPIYTQYGPLKRQWRKILDTWIKELRIRGIIPKPQFPLLGKRLMDALAPNMMKNLQGSL